MHIVTRNSSVDLSQSVVVATVEATGVAEQTNKNTRGIEMSEIRFSEDGSISMVWTDGAADRVPTQHDIDTLPVGADMTAEEVESLE